MAETLLRLAEAQGVCVAGSDWDGYLALATERTAVTGRLDPLVTGRRDLQPLLARIQACDQAQTVLMQAAEDDVLHELAGLRPQQVAFHAYFGGVVAGDDHEARFIDCMD